MLWPIITSRIANESNRFLTARFELRLEVAYLNNFGNHVVSGGR